METVLMRVLEGVAILTLNRPEKRNAFNREMSLALQDKLNRCADDTSIRCIMISGAGKAFSAGQDLSEALDPKGPAMQNILAEQYNPLIKTIRTIRKPVVAAVNGVAAGAAANVALCCDIVIAARSASFIQAFAKIGLIPDSGGTFILPRLVGMQKATALMMLAEPVPADDAERMGMIYKVFDDAVFEEEAVRLGIQLAKMPTKTLALTKDALNLSFTNTLSEQLQAEDELQMRAAKTHDFGEGVRAFVEKRHPLFKGE